MLTVNNLKPWPQLHEIKKKLYETEVSFYMQYLVLSINVHGKNGLYDYWLVLR